MPLKLQKKPVIKRKQNGKKIVKGQLARSKQKYEMESSPKEQISELEKEIFTIQINEYENKLGRKKHLCSYLEGEISIYKTLYNEKQLLKSESMKLLNNAFEDFSTEIFLLDQELDAMQHTYNGILHRQKFCSSYKERVQKLSVLEGKLGGNLFEAEKCVEELPELSEKLAELQEKAAKEKEKFINGKQQILREFETCLLSIQSELNLSINKAIEDKSLKLNLLPVPYRALFVNGFLSSAWLDSVSQFYDFLQWQNSEVQKTCYDLLLALFKGKEEVKMLFSDQDILLLFQLKKKSQSRSDENQLLSKPKKLETFDEVRNLEQTDKHFLHLEKMRLDQQNKVKCMKSEIKDLEAAIKSLEISGETTFEKSYLVQIICKAGSLLKQELGMKGQITKKESHSSADAKW